MLALVLVTGQLWYLQVLEGGHFLDASDKNRIRVRPIAAPRGILYDRNGIPLVDNRPAFTLSLIPRELPREPASRNAVLGRLAALLQIPYEELIEAVARVSADSFLTVRLRRGLSLTKVEEWKIGLPGAIVEVEPQRSYPSSRFAAHLLGREASDEQLKQGRHRRGDMVGQSGLERALDEFLRGRDGGEQIEVDALGRPVRMVQQTEPQAGAEVVTTIDRRIQEAAEERRRHGHGSSRGGPRRVGLPARRPMGGRQRRRHRRRRTHPGSRRGGQDGHRADDRQLQGRPGRGPRLVRGFAPARDPEVVVVVLVERGGKGGQVAAPIARKILTAVLSEKVAAAEVE